MAFPDSPRLPPDRRCATRARARWRLAAASAPLLALHIMTFGGGRAAAQEQMPVAGTDDACGTPLRLDGASAEPDSAHVNFDPAWRPTLASFASCMQREQETSCVHVRGQYDDHRFTKAVRSAFGSEHAAQVHRARSRAESVMAELLALGVPAERMVNVPPPSDASYRGVELRLVASCIPVREVLRASEASVATSTPVAEDAPSAVADSSTPPASRATESKAESTRGIGLEGQLGGGFMAASPEDIWYAVLRPRFGWFPRHGYVAGFGGLAIATAEEHRVGFEAGVTFGWAPYDWLQLGVLGSYGLASSRAFRAWLDRTWSVGLEMSERLWGNRVRSGWLYQSFSPASFLTRRASVRGGDLIDTVDRTEFAPRIEIGITLRTTAF